MGILSNNYTSLELSIAMPGLSSSPPFQFSGEGGSVSARDLDLDINQTPLGVDEDECMDEEYESHNGGGQPRKKLRLTKEQSRVLEESFKLNHTLNPKQKEGLAEQLNLKSRQVEVWFQNRRARSKLKQTEMECEYLKRCYGSLSEQNRRLRKEVEELRGMKIAGPPDSTDQQPRLAATRTMCPHCERVATAFLDKGPAATTSNTSGPFVP